MSEWVSEYVKKKPLISRISDMHACIFLKTVDSHASHA